MAGQELSIQGAPIWSVTSATCVHESPMPLAMLGMSKGDQDFRLYQRSPDCSIIKGANCQGHCSRSGKAAGAGFFGQAVKITAHPIKEDSASWLHHQLERHDIVSTS